MNLFCFGFGQVAESFVSKIISKNIEINLFFTSRNPNTKKIKFDINHKCFKLDEHNHDEEISKAILRSNKILISIPPSNGQDLVLSKFSEQISSSKADWITYLSATSVYGDHKGGWVDENTKCKPTSKNGLARLSVENGWMNLFQKKNIPIQILRIAGIYSNTNNILTRLKSGDAKVVRKKNQFFSRIHLEDISNILYKSFESFKSGEIYNISDDMPASSEELTIYGSKILNIEVPKQVELDDLRSEMLINFFKDSKKVSNKKMKNFFRYNLKYPTYREGLDYIKDYLK